MVQTHEEADDLTQETFIKVYKNLKKFEGKSKMFTWIYRIAVNTGLNYLRKQKMKNYLGLDKVALKADSEKKDFSEESKKLLQRAIKKLPAKQQMVIILRALQEMSYREISQIMDISINSAKVNYSHGLKNLKDKLETMGVNYESL
jgi:RNA polymerase sigma-70 factor (ECF subfamily)